MTDNAGSGAVAWEFRQRSAIGRMPQRSAPWCDWVSIRREDYELYARNPNDLVQVRALYAIPDAAQARIRELRDLLEESRAELVEAAGDYHWTPQPDFLSRIDAALTSSARPIPSASDPSHCGWNERARPQEESK